MPFTLLLIGSCLVSMSMYAMESVGPWGNHPPQTESLLQENEPPKEKTSKKFKPLKALAAAFKGKDKDPKPISASPYSVIPETPDS